MTVYYVSQQTAGASDSNNGTAISTPWLTVSKATQTLVAGDTCVIGPGVYREKPVCINAGASGSLITYTGDTDCDYLINDRPGIVRITGCSVDEKPSTVDGHIFNKNAKAYIVLKYLYIDGGIGAGYSAVNCPSSNDGGNLKCYAQHNYCGFGYGINRDCIGIGGYQGFYGGTSYNSIGFGRSSFTTSAVCYNCIAISANYGFNSSTVYNGLSIGGYTGSVSCTIVNSVSIGSLFGFAYDTAYNCIAIASNNGYWAGALSGCYASGCVSASYASEPPTGDAPKVVSQVMFGFDRIFSIAKCFEPTIISTALKQLGYPAVQCDGYDVLGRPRKMLGDNIELGPWALSNLITSFTSGDYNTEAPGITITNEGQQEFELPVKDGVAINVSCQSKYTGTNASYKPQLILRGDSITEQTDTHSGAASTWEELTVSATPSKDDILKVILYARDPGTAATLTTALTGTNNDLVFTARSKGTFGNNITIQYTNPGAASQSLSLTVTEKAVNISLATDSGSVITTTAAQIKTFIETNANANVFFASALIGVAYAGGNDGSGIVTTMSATALNGGADPVSYFSDLEVS